MNKYLNIFLATLLAIPPNALGQANVVRPNVVETISTVRNYVRNPSANRNTAGVSATNATITRDTTAANKIDGVASFSCDTSALNGYCEWAMVTIQKPDDAGNCEASAYIKGDGSLYSLQLTDGTSALATVALANQASYTQFKVYGACGATRTVRVVQSSAGTSPAINVGRVYYGPETAQASSPAGAKNYLGTYKNVRNNGDFETGALGSWVLGNAALTSAFPSGAPTFGSGANANLSQSIVSSSPLSGSYSYAYISSAATTAGNFLASPVFAIDQSDQSKVLTFKFNFKAQSNGSNANWSGTSSNSFGVAIYDVTNSAWIMPAGTWAMTQSSGVGVATGTFQTAANSSQFRLVVFNANATSGAVTLYFDDFSVGPQATMVGAPVTDWQAYTPTFQGFGSPTNINFQWRRVGSNLEVRGYFTAGTTTAVEARVYLPSGLSTISSAPTLSILPGSTFMPATSSTGWANNAQVLLEPSVSYVSFAVPGSSTLSKVNASVAAGTGANASIAFSLPIQGWSSQVQTNSDYDGRVIAARYSNAATTITNTTFATLPFPTKSIDTTASFNGASGVFIAPASGTYSVASQVKTGGFSGGVVFYLSIFVNGVEYSGNVVQNTANYSASITAFVKDQVYLNAGDQVTIRAKNSAGAGGIDPSGLYNWVVIEKLSGSPIIAANEFYGARYTNTAGTTITSTYAAVPFATKTFDSHGSFDGTTFRAKGPGTFLVSAALNMSQGSQPVLFLAIYKNGALYSEWSSQYSSSTTPITLSIVDSVPLIDGDTLTIYAKNSVGNVALSTSAGRNFFNVIRTGN